MVNLSFGGVNGFTQGFNWYVSPELFGGGTWEHLQR